MGGKKILCILTGRNINQVLIKLVAFKKSKRTVSMFFILQKLNLQVGDLK